MRYHIVGIAGAGMSAMANLLLDQGHTLSGSDLKGSAVVDALAARGATIRLGHDSSFLGDAEALLVTSAAPPDHPEIAAARARGLPVLKRADLWRSWSQERDVVAIAGTHGKTTTTAMIALILQHAGRDPGFLVGGDVPDLGVNARWGDPAAPLVIEADEYDRTFLALTPRVAVVTNVEWDHVDIYPTPAEYDAAFAQFAASVRTQRDLIVCDDDPGTQRAIDAPGATYYGIDEALASDPVSCRLAPQDWSAANVRAGATGVTFDLWHYSRRTFGRALLGSRTITVYGLHNVRNALAATAAAAALAVPQEQIAAALASYHGAGRRFELKGEAGGVTVIDDYAHHPTEVRATLQAARSRYSDRRLVVYIQPHTYSRTRALLDEWASAFADADVVRVGEIFAAREPATPGIDAALLAARINHDDVQAVGGIGQAVAHLGALLQPGDVLLTLGAGDGYLVGERVLEELRM